MKRLAHFTLEGLMQQGPHNVWIPLGTFASAELASQAQGNTTRDDIVQTRVMALYRDSGDTHAVEQSYVSPAMTSDSVSTENVTVA